MGLKVFFFFFRTLSILFCCLHFNLDFSNNSEVLYNYLTFFSLTLWTGHWLPLPIFLSPPFNDLKGFNNYVCCIDYTYFLQVCSLSFNLLKIYLFIECLKNNCVKEDPSIFWSWICLFMIQRLLHHTYPSLFHLLGLMKPSRTLVLDCD